jgi:hypothetical protein
MDFAAIEAAEMDDMVSPLTPVERAMLYKQQGLGRHGPNRVVNNVSPLTPGEYFTQAGQNLGGFHAI